MDASLKRLAPLPVALLLAVALLGSQAAADALAPPRRTGQADVVGRAGFAYVASLRRFAAAVLWNRIEPQFHEYYSDAGLREMAFVLPNTRLIVALDPQLVEPYYVAPFILWERGAKEEALALAEEGVENNPDSGRLRASYAQLLHLSGDLPGGVEQADAAVQAHWRDAVEEWEGLAAVRAVYEAAGESAKQRAVEAALEVIDAEIKSGRQSDDHDHDGDGRPDH